MGESFEVLRIICKKVEPVTFYPLSGIWKLGTSEGTGC